MTIEFTVDLIEQKKTLLFVTGMALTDIALGDAFSRIYQYGNSKKSKRERGTVVLNVESIIQDGEPVETLPANTAGMLALSGDPDVLLTVVADLNWQHKKKRYIRTSDTALTVADE
ncbi:MAG: hypothetical protein AAF126_14815 [Chloroflexota bacterium]